MPPTMFLTWWEALAAMSVLLGELDLKPSLPYQPRGVDGYARG
jgi:hypothetical protein